MADRDEYIGIYWTRAVPWAGFHGAFGDADAAAQQSRTIRYQRDRVQRFVAGEGGTLLQEVVLTDPEPDRASPESVSALRKTLARAAPATIFVHVDFSAVNGWRRHPYLTATLAGRRTISLTPDPLLTDEGLFDPIAHFRQWQAADERHRDAKDAYADMIMRRLDALAHLAWPGRAAALNDAGLATHGGKLWTGDNLRKFTKAQEMRPHRGDPE